jgi:methylglutaconyl-CoA hydratase
MGRAPHRRLQDVIVAPLTPFKSIKLEEKARIAYVTLARPEVRNAFGTEMIRELTEVFTTLSSRRDLFAVVLRGEGKSFCSGADLSYMQSMAGFTLEENERDSQSLFAMFWALRSCPHPLIARVQGHVMGGGLGLAAVCDIVAAVDGTQFCFSEVRLGLAPAVISSFVLERMSMASARRFMLTGEVFSAADAYAGGLVQLVGSEAEVDAFITSTVGQFMQNGPEAVRATKGLLRAVGEMTDWSRRRELTTRLISERRVSDEGQEGIRGFLEKRAPKWRPV